MPLPPTGIGGPLSIVLIPGEAAHHNEMMSPVVTE
jgi:hypothetical protein